MIYFDLGILIVDSGVLAFLDLCILIVDSGIKIYNYCTI